MSTPAVDIQGLHKRYGELEVLRGVDLTVSEGERVAIIGASGSGKSTLLRMVMGLEAYDQGHVRVEGEPLRDEATGELHREVTLRVGMVFQHFHLFPHMTALDNVCHAPRRVLGLSPEEARRRGEQLLEQVDLADKADAWPAQLSGGQKQRVAIARALAMEPEVLLLDEITSALDPELVGGVLEIVRDLAGKGGTTILLVTHQMGFAREFADRLLFFHAGRIHEQGPPAKLLDDPQKERTREFLQSVLRP